MAAPLLQGLWLLPSCGWAPFNIRLLPHGPIWLLKLQLSHPYSSQHKGGRSEEGSLLRPCLDTLQKLYMTFLPLFHWSDLVMWLYLAVCEDWKYTLWLGQPCNLLNKRHYCYARKEQNIDTGGKHIRKRKFTWTLTTLYSEMVVKMMIMIIPTPSIPSTLN